MRIGTDGIHNYCVMRLRPENIAMTKSGFIDIMDLNRYAQFPARLPLSRHEPGKPRTTTSFVRHLNIRTLPAYYKQRTPDLKVTQWVSYMGKTSAVSEMLYTNPITNETIATSFLHLVYVDFKTRRPIPVPIIPNRPLDITRTAPPANFTQSPKPAEVFSYTTMVVSSDTDRNQHMNTSSYIKNCIDAGSDAACKGHLVGFKTELAFYSIETISQLYLGEALIGDQLEVHCWQDAANDRWLNFEILNRSKVICQCQIKLYDRPTVARSYYPQLMSKL